MALLVFMFALPVLCIVGWIVQLVRGRRTGLLAGLLMSGITVAAGYWSIMQSRASTAGIGVLFLPGAGALSGISATLFARLRRDPQKPTRVFAWLCLVASVGVAVLFGVGGIQERRKNTSRDRLQVEYRGSIDENRLRIAQLIRENPGNEIATLDGEIARHRRDGTFLIPALETPFVSEGRLDELSADDDLNVVLMVARNPHTPSGTLEKIYLKSSYPPYFFVALAEHQNTPVAILRAISGQSTSNTGIDRALAGNPSAPRDILDRIAGSGDVYDLRSLMGNAALDCGLLRKAAARLSPADRNEVHSSDRTIALLEARLCAAK
jgi:hypothetical protein